jgi:hypothetical protein
LLRSTFNRKRDERRELASCQGARVAECVAAMTPHLSQLGMLVDMEGRTAAEVATLVHGVK